MKMKYAGYKVNINDLEDGLKTAIKISEILKGFEREKIKVEVDIERLRVIDLELPSNQFEADELELSKIFDAVIFKVFLPKKKADFMAKHIPINFFSYAGKQVICQSTSVAADGTYDDYDTLRLIYPLEYNISHLLDELGTIETLHIRGEKFHPLAIIDNPYEAWNYIRAGGYDCINYRIYRITNPNNKLGDDDFMNDEWFLGLTKK